MIGRIASRHELKNDETRRKLQSVEMGLAHLRAAFEEMVKSGDIRPCGCDLPECPMYQLSSSAADELHQLRDAVLEDFESASPTFRRLRI